MLRIAIKGFLTCALAACATVQIPSPDTQLSEDQIIDLVEHPKRWDGRTVKIRIYPYDNGFAESYVVCLDRCNAARAERSPFLIYTRANRFKAFKGDRPVVVKARYDSRCFYKGAAFAAMHCVHFRYGRFTEIG